MPGPSDGTGWGEHPPALRIPDHERILVPGIRYHVNGKVSGVIATYESGRQVGYYESGAIYEHDIEAWAWTEQQLAASEVLAEAQAENKARFIRDLREEQGDNQAEGPPSGLGRVDP